MVDEDDVMKEVRPGYRCVGGLLPLDGDEDAPHGRCPKCSEALEQGYGMMGGGVGSYSFCATLDDKGNFHWMDKSEDGEDNDDG